MYKFVYICVVFLFYITVSLSKRHLPSYLKVCKRDDPQLNECIISAIASLQPHLVDGIPEMGLPRFNPFHVIQLGYDTGTVKFDFKNVDFGLAHTFNISNLKMDIEGCKLSFDVYFPLLVITGDYTLVGKLFILDLNGTGTFSANVTSSFGTVDLLCKKETQNDLEYLKFHDFDIQMKISDLKLKLNDLFKNNEQLTDVTNNAINENSKALAADFDKFLAKGIGEIVLHEVKGVFERFPIDELIPK